MKRFERCDTPDPLRVLTCEILPSPLVAGSIVYRSARARRRVVNAMLLNEFLKEHRAFLKAQQKVDEQQATIAQLKSTVAQQQKGMEALAASVKEQALQIQKVSAQIELNTLAPRLVLKNQ